MPVLLMTPNKTKVSNSRRYFKNSLSNRALFIDSEIHMHIYRWRDQQESRNFLVHQQQYMLWSEDLRKARDDFLEVGYLPTQFMSQDTFQFYRRTATSKLIRDSCARSLYKHIYIYISIATLLIQQNKKLRVISGLKKVL